MKTLRKIAVFALVVAAFAVAFVACDKGTETKYAVTFNANGGSSVAAQEVVKGEAIATAPASTYDGYTLLGWTTTKDDAATKVTFPYTPQGDVTLYALWEQNAPSVEQWTVTLEANGGTLASGVTSSIKVDKGGKISAEPQATKPNLSFGGWATTAGDESTIIDFQNGYTPAADVTLYATWYARVTFDANGGVASEDFAILLEGAKLANVPVDPERHDIENDPIPTHAFLGWFTAATAGEEINFDSKTFSANTTVYAQWKAYSEQERDAIRWEGWVAISTADDLKSYALNGGSDKLYLKNDIDMSYVALNRTKTSTFSGVLEGRGHNIIGLNMNVTGYYGGLFHVIAGTSEEPAAVRNITFVNPKITSTNDRAGVVAGQSTGIVNIENVNILNPVVNGSNSSNGTGILIGVAGSASTETTLGSAKLTVNNTAIINGQVNCAVAGGTGALIGSVNGAVAEVRDVYIQDVSINQAAAGARSGGVVGDLKFNGDRPAGLTLERVVLNNVDINANTLGGTFIGRVENSSNKIINFTINDSCFINGSLAIAAVDGANTYDVLYSRVTNVSQISVPTVKNVWIVNSVTPAANLNQHSADIEASADTDEAWWGTELDAIAESDAWTYDETAECMIIEIPEIEFCTMTIHLNYSGAPAPLAYTVVVGTKLERNFYEPLRSGYRFNLWSKTAVGEESDLIDEAFTIEDDLTIYATWIQTFVIEFYKNYGKTDTDALMVISQDIGYQMDAQDVEQVEGIEPERLGYIFVGWALSKTETDPDKILSADDFLDYEFAADQVYYAIWERNPNVDLFTVTYLVNAQNVQTEDVVDGDKASGYFEINDGKALKWYKEAAFTTAWNFDTDTVTAATTLYGRWETATDKDWASAGYTAISTAAQLNDISNDGGTGLYYLKNDITASSYTWQNPLKANPTFGGSNTEQTVFDGNGYSITGLVIGTSTNPTTTYGGLFPQANYVTFRNIVFENCSIQSSARAGLIVGHSGSGGLVFENISVISCSVTGNAGEGASLLVGNINAGTNAISNIYIKNSTSTNTNQAAGVIVGRFVAGNLTVNDVYAESVTATTSNSNGGAGFIGRVSGTVDSLSIDRVVMNDVTLSVTNNSGKNAAIVVGRCDGTLTAMTVNDLYFNGTVENQDTTTLNYIIGTASKDGGTTTARVYTTCNLSGATQAGKVTVVATTSVNQAWWSTNLDNIASNALWQWSGTGNVFQLKLAATAA